MNKLLLWAAFLLMLTSCTKKYKIEGTSSVTSLDGKMAFVKVIKNNEMVIVDSAEVVHGTFVMKGNADSVQLGTLFIDDQSIMPIVLENGTMNVMINLTEQKVSGTPLNDKLYTFIEKKNQLDVRAEELSHEESKMIMDGKDPVEVQQKIMAEAQKLRDEAERMETDFITGNFDNVLGLGVFMMLSGGYPYPVMTPQIEEIVNKAPVDFKNNDYVKEYLSAAKENLRRMQLQQPIEDKFDNQQPQGGSPVAINGAPTYLTE